MKKSFIFILFLASLAGFAQGITVDPSYTPTQLINDVLINSPCISATNIVASTGSDFGSTNGIGYFENANPNFPFAKGIVLMTGDVTKVPSPNNSVLSDGTSAWTGDADLEANLLSQSGVTINSTNASYISFQFTPKTANLSFDFIFASEEYGPGQCNFSDAFAFLIKDLSGGPDINIALVPGGAPVSVATIRNNLYGPSCSSENPSYFGAFNGPGFGPAINFNGQTVKMSALATGLNTTHVYRIKLVIADGGNNPGYDSAIFLNANSFNSTPNVLGPDKAVCSGATLPTLQPSPALTGTFQWKLNGTNMVGQTSQILNLNSPTVLPAPVPGDNVYTLEYTEPGCSALTDDITVKIYAPINVMATVPNIYTCNTSAANYNFDLTKNTTIILANNGSALASGTEVTYHMNNTDAANDAPGIATTHNILSSQSGQVIYARIENPEHTCYEIRTFKLLVVASPVIATTPTSITLCARNVTDATPRASFDLTAIINDVYGAQDRTYNVISFHANTTSANNPTSSGISIPNTAAFITPSRPLCVRLANISDPGCFVVICLQLTVTPLAQVDIFPDVVVCTDFVLPPLTYPGSGYFEFPNGGTPLAAGDHVFNKTIYVYNPTGGCPGQDSFKVTKSDLPSIVPVSDTYCTSYTLPSLPYGKYRTASIANGGGTEITTAITTTQDVWAYFEDTSIMPSCEQEQKFTITIQPFIVLPNFPNQFGCSSYTLPTPTTDANLATYSYWGDSTHNTTPILPPYIISSLGQNDVYVYKHSGTSPLDCEDVKHFTVYIGPGEIVTPADVTSCSCYTLPTLTVGEYRDAPNGGGNLITAPICTAGDHDVYIYVPGQACTNNIHFKVTVSIDALPSIPDQPAVCDIYYFPYINHTGAYYSGPNGTGTKYLNTNPPTSFTTLAGLHTYYFYDKIPSSTCSVEEPFDVTIYPSPAIDARPVYVPVCNSCHTLDTLTNGHYYANQGGPANNTGILDGTQICGAGLHTIWVYSGSVLPNTCFQEYKIEIEIFNTVVLPVNNVEVCDTYTLPSISGPGDYWTATGGPNGLGTKISPPYTAMGPGSSPYTFYVYAEDNNRIPCSDEKSFTVIVNQTPVVAPIAPKTACDSYTLPPLVAPATAYYKYPGGPAGNGGSNPVVTGPITMQIPNSMTETTTIYAYAEVGTPGHICYDEEAFVITLNRSPVIPAIPMQYACDTYTLPNPSTFFAGATKYYSTNPGTGASELFAGNPINTTSTIFVYAETGTTPNCFTYAPLDITIYYTPVVAPIAPKTACDSYTLPPLVAPATAYYTYPGGPAGNGGSNPVVTGPITITNGGTAQTTTIYAYAETGITGHICYDEEPFAITISKTPILVASEIDDEYACDTYTLPALTTGIYTESDYITPRIGGLVITSTTATTNPIYVHAENPANPSCFVNATFNVYITPTPVFVPSDIATVNACDHYDLPVLATPGASYYTGPNGTGTVILPGAPYANPTQVVYVHAVNGTAPHQCPNDAMLTINVYNVDELLDVTRCGSYQLPVLSAVGAAYYTQPGGAGTVYNGGDIFTTQGTTTLYVYGTSGSCSDQSDVVITINASATYTAPSLLETTVCDTDGNNNDHVTPFNLDSLTATILGTQSNTDYAVGYFPSQTDATLFTNQIVTDNGPLPDSALNTVYVRVYNIITPSCSDYGTVTINVVPLPEGTPLNAYICTDSDSGQIYPAHFESGYSPLYYNFEWKDANGVVVSNASNYDATIAGNYTLEITAQGLTGCDSGIIPITAGQSATAATIDYESTGWFTDHQTLTITVTPNPADFVFSLDGNTPQSSNIFTDVTSGMHEVTAINIYGCGTAPLPVQVPLVNNPKYFSPNGDGVNEEWKIPGLEPGAEIFIYDRYGKMIKQLTENEGWDGTLNGTPLPSSDYWFTVTYTENGIPKEFKSHFSLIR